MRGGDAHGPERLFDVEVAFDNDGIVRSMKMRALENLGAYAGRSPFQLGKPIGAIVGPYKIKSVEYRALAVVTNKTTQDAVRGFGQGPTNLALERAMDEVANTLQLDRLEVRRRNMIRANEFPYLIPSGTTYDSGDYEGSLDQLLDKGGYAELLKEQEQAHVEGRLVGDVHTNDVGGDRPLDVADRLQDTLAPVAVAVAVAQLESLVLTGGSAGGNDRGGAALFCGRGHRNGGIAARVEDLLRAQTHKPDHVREV
jgi:hypothetical protein